MARYRIFVTLVTFLVLAVFGTIAILFARGYRISFDENSNNLQIGPRGLLVANSDPNGAQVFVDGELKTATNNTVSLAPKTYEVEVRKEGFLPWNKKITIEKETVTQIDAFLVARAPSLTALTFSGVFNPVPSPDNTKIAYAVPPSANNEDDKAGLWILETVDLPLGFNRDPRRVTDGDLTNADWRWSPDGRQILLTTENGAFLLDTGVFTAQQQRRNILSQLETIEKEWKVERENRLQSKLSGLHDDIEKVFIRSATNIRFSPDEDRILYTARADDTIPENIVPQLPGSSTQPQERQIKTNQTYVYDMKEDRNFRVGTRKDIISWLPNSLNLLHPQEDKIIIKDYDNTNQQTIFSGNYAYPHAYATTSSNRILILTSLGGSSDYANLYWLSLK